MMPCNMNNNRAGRSCSCGRPAPQPRSCGCSNGTDFRSRGNCENLRGGRPACPENQARLMEQIQQCEFICVDINLYLDTHPCLLYTSRRDSARSKISRAAGEAS